MIAASAGEKEIQDRAAEAAAEVGRRVRGELPDLSGAAAGGKRD